ncbi:hypothetical protein MMC21_000965 [Puttea exsequens]|nr:hypothetical protein [Puttea exsequens]
MSLEALSRIKYAPDFKARLGQLPARLSGLYDIIHDQIDQTETYGRNVAIKTLKWLLCAQRLLSVEELLAAVDAVGTDDSSDSDFDDESQQARSPENDILRLCCNLVVLDSERRTFRFAHQSVQEYLLTLSRYTSLEQHSLATQRCLDVYLNTSTLASSALLSIQQNEVFRDYAQIYWPVHYTCIKDTELPEIEEMVSRFLVQESTTSQLYKDWVSHLQSRFHTYFLTGNLISQSLGLAWFDSLGARLRFPMSRPETPVSLACAFGLLRFLETYPLSESDLKQVYQVGMDRYTALIIAAHEGHQQVVQLLLDRGANINALYGHYDTALMVASGEGHHQVTRLLLDKGADINAQGDGYTTALQAASWCGHHQIVQLLLERGANIDTEGEGYGTALQAASFRGHDQVVQQLLDRGADINAQGKDRGTALYAASDEGHQQVVQLLLDKGASIDAQGGSFGTALTVASIRGDPQLVTLLLDGGANTNVESDFGRTALQAASFFGNHQAVQLLLASSADLYQRDTQGSTAILQASAGGHTNVVQMLASQASDLLITDYQRRNCLHYAASQGHGRLVDWLLEQDLDLNIIDRDGWTPLHWAARSRSGATAQLLKSAGTIVCTENIQGWTPAAVAIYHCNEDFLKATEVTIGLSPLHLPSSALTSNILLLKLGWEVGSNTVSPGFNQGNQCDGCNLVSHT